MRSRHGVGETVIVSVAAGFQEGILSQTELAALGSREPSVFLLAKRFAAKKALFSCLAKIGFDFYDFTAVSVTHDAWGKPIFGFTETLASQIAEHRVKSVLVSIADEKCSACAYVVLNLE